MEAPSVEEAARRWSGRVPVVGVAWNGTDEAIAGFVADAGLTFAQVTDRAGEVFARYGVPYQPAWVFIDAAGAATTRLGVLSESELESALGSALAAGGP